MTKKRVLPVKKYETATFQVQDTILKTQASCMPTNLAEEKEKFLRNGKTPKFHIKDRSKVEQLALKTKNNIRFELFGEAQYILEKVRDQYGNGEYYLEHAFGPRITKEEATPTLLKYIAENNVPESLKINWCENLTCSAKMVWTGPNVNSNRPELRKYSLWLNGSEENPYMRESGIRCLMDHEIGTHFYRSFNDGLQPWYADRERFGLRKLGTFEGQCTEEGLAAIHTVLRGRIRYLWGAAMGYYIACKSAEMTFKELFDHLGRFTSNQDYRWKQAMRVKRGLPNPNDLGGFGNDQCYFEGAVNILRRMEDIDFQLMMMGKVCYDELDRIKRVARKDVVQYPNFMKNMNGYKKSLRKILALNGLEGLHPQRGPPAVYIKHLEEKKRGKTSHKGKKVRNKGSSSSQRKSKSSPISKTIENHLGGGDSEEDCELKSYECSYPFLNMHLREKPVSEIEKFLQSETPGLKDVKALTCSISAKDGIMNMQLEKLQDIVKNHTWSKMEDANADAEMWKEDAPPEIHKSPESLLIRPSIDDEFNNNSIVHGLEETIDELTIDTEKAELNSDNVSATVTYTLCPSEEYPDQATLTGESNSEDTQPICLHKDSEGSPKEAKKTKIATESKSGSRIVPRKVLAQRSNQDKRRVLRTPITSLSSFDELLEQTFVPRETGDSHMIDIQKRVSLNGNKISNTEKMNGGNVNERSMLSQSLSKNNPENLVKEKLFQHRGDDPLRFKKENSKLGKSHLNNKEFNDASMLYTNIPNRITGDHSRSIFMDNRRPAGHVRPLSSGSERILELHWKDLKTSTSPLLQRKPLRPNEKPFLNVNHKNNNLTPIKRTSCSVDNSLFRDAF